MQTTSHTDWLALAEQLNHAIGQADSGLQQHSNPAVDVAFQRLQAALHALQKNPTDPAKLRSLQRMQANCDTVFEMTRLKAQALFKRAAQPFDMAQCPSLAQLNAVLDDCALPSTQPRTRTIQ